MRKSVGFEDGGINLVVNLFEKSDETLGVDDFFFGVESFVGAEFFENVVKAGKGEVGVLGLASFAMGIKLLAKVAQALAKFRTVVEVGEGEFVEGVLDNVCRSWPNIAPTPGANAQVK